MKDSRLKVLMVGVGPETKGGMWSVAANYINNSVFSRAASLEYVATATSYSATKAEKVLKALSGILRAHELLRTERFDIVHVHMAERGSFFRKAIIVKMAKRASVPVVIHMHGGSFGSFYSKSPRAIRRKIVRTLQQASTVIALGSVFAELYISMGVDKDRISVLPNAVEVQKTNPYNSRSRNVLFLGTISKDKGIIDYLDAIEEALPTIGTDYIFKNFGPIGDVDLDRQIEMRGLEHRVTYGGFLDPAKRQAELENSVALVLPSHFEVFPMCILEAMGYGVPVISTNVGSVSDAIEDGVNGVLVRPRDSKELSEALIRLLSDRDLRTRLSAQAHQRAVEQYSLDKHVESLLRIYRSALKTKEVAGEM